MPATFERQNLIKKIASFPNALDERISQFDETHLDIPVRPGEWTVRQIVHHLADAHLNGYIRMKLVATESRPILKPYNQEDWSILGDMKMPIQPSLQILRGLHERWAAFMENLPEESWSRTGVHLENGLVNLDDLLSSYVHHCETHLDQINQLQK